MKVKEKCKCFKKVGIFFRKLTNAVLKSKLTIFGQKQEVQERKFFLKGVYLSVND